MQADQCDRCGQSRTRCQNLTMIGLHTYDMQKRSGLVVHGST